MWNVLFEEQHLRLVIDWPQIFQVRKPKQRHLCFSFDTNFINQSFSVRSRLSNDRHAARLRGSLTISKCVLLLLLFKMNATRDWNRKGSSCGGVLGQLSHEVLVQHCFSSGLRLNDHTSNLFLTIVITLHLFKVIKYYWKARDQRSKSVLLVLPPDTTQNNPTSIIHHLQSCHFLWFFILCATEFQGAHLPCSHVNLSAFLKHHSTYLQDNEKIELCGVARAFVQISENGPRSKKFGHSCSMWIPAAYTNSFKSKIKEMHFDWYISEDEHDQFQICRLQNTEVK